MKVQCLGCGRVGPWGRAGRCPMCVRPRGRDVDPVRRARRRARYGPAHREDRAAWAPLVAAGGVRCWRCGELIESGAVWDLGHRDGLPSRPEHAGCNRSAGSEEGPCRS